MLISELAEKVGLHPETIRRLERRGVISARRDLNGWRQFSPAVVEQIKMLYAQGDNDGPAPKETA